MERVQKHLNEDNVLVKVNSVFVLCPAEDEHMKPEDEIPEANFAAVAEKPSSMISESK